MEEKFECFGKYVSKTKQNVSSVPTVYYPQCSEYSTHLWHLKVNRKMWTILKGNLFNKKDIGVSRRL